MAFFQQARQKQVEAGLPDAWLQGEISTTNVTEPYHNHIMA